MNKSDYLNGHGLFWIGLNICLINDHSQSWHKVFFPQVSGSTEQKLICGLDKLFGCLDTYARLFQKLYVIFMPRGTYKIQKSPI